MRILIFFKFFCNCRGVEWGWVKYEIGRHRSESGGGGLLRRFWSNDNFDSRVNPKIRTDINDIIKTKFQVIKKVTRSTDYDYKKDIDRKITKRKIRGERGRHFITIRVIRSLEDEEQKTNNEKNGRWEVPTKLLVHTLHRFLVHFS